MAIFSRPDSPFWYYRCEGTTLRVNTKVPVDAPTEEQRRKNKQTAQLLYNAHMGDLARDRKDLPTTRAKPPAFTFAELVAWYETHELPQHRGAEREREILPRLVTAFGHLELAAIDPTAVSEWMTRRAKKAGPSTINREVDVLKGVLQVAVPKYLPASPLFGMKRLRTVTPKRRLMSEDEERRLLAVMDADDKALFLVGLDALVRLSDILDVRKTDDHGRELWIADPKAGGGFPVPLSSRARAAIDAMPEMDSVYLFPRRRGAKTARDRRKGVRQMLKMYCRLADPPLPYGRKTGGLTFHWATRRTGATRMLSRGSNPGTVQKVGRWKTSTLVLDIYHDLIDDDARKAVESVGRVAGAEKG